MAYEELKTTMKVDSKNQLKDSPAVRFENLDKNGIKVLFVGNSITLHGRKEDIGWFGDWGMAASSKEKDYVHLMEAEIQKTHPDAQFCICNAAEWEREYKNGSTTFNKYETAREFDADIITVKLCENSPADNFDGDAFKKNFAEYIEFLNKSGKAQIVVATAFCGHPAEDAIKAYSNETGCALCILSDIASQEKFKAIGLFEHEGVANHPGDLGMQEIADRMLAQIKL